jgi:LysR family glycine cleavage system transcriptional activator
LRSIAAFEAVARHGSFHKAADEINLTTSAVSHSIKALETRLNQRLFNRSHGNVSLTEAGISLLARVRLSLELLGDAFGGDPAQQKQRLIVSALPSIARKLIIPKLASLQAEMRCLSIDVHATTSVESVESEVDVAIRFGPAHWRGVESSFIAHEELIAVASPGYWQQPLPQTPAELKAANLICDRESSWRLWLSDVGLSFEDFPSTLKITDSALIVDAAVGGLGVALARRSLVQDELKSAKLIRLFERSLPLENAHWAVWSGSSPNRVSIQRFHRWAVRQFAP